MTPDKPDAPVKAENRFMHGAIYHMLWDRPLASARKKVIELVPNGASVIDVACGTGEFCFELAAQKNCRVFGIDLSFKMIEFARNRNRHDTVRFEFGDAADLARFGTSEFDFATILLLLHEVPGPVRIAAVMEALRIAKKTVIVDSLAPLPLNIHGVALRIVEAIGGSEHFRSFADFLEAGGISGILRDSSIKASIIHRSVFWYGCRELVVLESQEK
ncbi:MAG: class I SAM-dependent methyltransferase [Candidatus Zixiibacteriota bacterium]